MGQQILTPIARPRAYSAYNIELGAQVCEAIGNGMLLHQIAKLPGMPSAATIYSWIGKHAEFRDMYEFALMARFDLMCEELKAIADSSDEQDRALRRIKTRQWIMAKRLPRVYADNPPAVAAPPQQPALSHQLPEVPWLEERRRQREAATSAKRVTGIDARNADTNITEKQ